MLTVNLEQFATRFGETLEIPDDYFKSVPLKDVTQYDSMAKINVSLLIEELFGFQIDYEILDTQETLESLYNYCVLNAKAGQ